MPGLLQDIISLLSRPVYAGAGAARAALNQGDPWAAAKRGLLGETTNTYSDVLGDLGMEPGVARSVAGFVGDVALDPTTYMGGLIPKAARLIPGASKAATMLKEWGPVAALGKRFIPYYGLPEEFTKLRRLGDAEQQFLRGQAADEAIGLFKGLPAELRKTIPLAMEDPTLVNSTIRPALEGAQAGLARQAEREVAAGILDPAAVREGYVTHIYNQQMAPELYRPLAQGPKELNAASRFSKPREFDTLKQAMAAGASPELDIAKVYAIRKYAGDKAIATQDMLKKVIENPEWARKIEDAPFGWAGVQVPASHAFSKQLNEYAFDPRIAENLNELIARKSGMADDVRAFDKLLQAWKTTATVMRPGFHPRNAISNAYNAFIAGQNPLTTIPRTLQAARFVAHGTPESLPAVLGKSKYTREQVADLAKRYGILSEEFGTQGNLGDAVAKRMQEALDPKGVAMKVLGAWPNLGRTVGRGVENTGRMNLFLDQLAKGRSAEDAMTTVNKWMINYGEKTPFERDWMSRLFPFWQWTSRNIPLQVESLINTPGRPAALFKGYHAASEAAGGMPPMEQVPDYMQEGGLVRLPFKTVQGSPTFWSPNLPIQDLARLPGEASMEELARVLRGAVGMVNPAIKAPFELAANKDYFLNRPLRNEQNPDLPVQAPNWVTALVAAGLPPEALGADIINRPRLGPQVQMNPLAAYLGRQVPILESLGKAGLPDRAGRETMVAHESVPGGIPAGLIDSMMGIRPVAITPQQAQQNAQMERLRTVRRARALRQLANREIDLDTYQQMLER